MLEPWILWPALAVLLGLHILTLLAVALLARRMYDADRTLWEAVHWSRLVCQQCPGSCATVVRDRVPGGPPAPRYGEAPESPTWEEGERNAG